MKKLMRLVVLGLVFGGLVVGLLGPAAEMVSAEPRAIVLSDFSAKPKPGQKVKLKWATGTESSVVGFNVWRAKKATKPFTKLNETLIAPKNPGGLEGASYGFMDKTVVAGKNYFYKVEVIKLNPPHETSDVIKVTAKP